jgi:DNA-binding NarL/FixJ family response regulator
MPTEPRLTRILIADDSSAVRRALTKLLQTTYGCEVIEVQDGQEAVLRALEFSPDLAILDLAMPIVDGLTAAREISKVLPDLPIVMYTMHSTPALDLAAQKSGVRRLLSKTRPAELLECVEQVLGMKAKEGATEPEGGVGADIPIALPEPEIIAAENGSSGPKPDVEKKSTEN